MTWGFHKFINLIARCLGWSEARAVLLVVCVGLSVGACGTVIGVVVAKLQQPNSHASWR